MRTYYNEIDPFAAGWLRNLTGAQDVIDTRSIKDVRGSDLGGFGWCHFFAGIAGWDRALMLAGWPVGLPVWTGSCPCQPFSSAGKGLGEADARHLWPEFLRLIAECRPPVLFGEQVASKAGRQWLAGVRADLEALGYVVGAADLCAAGVGAPHIRQRLYWMAHDASAGRREGRAAEVGSTGCGGPRLADRGPASGLGDDDEGLEGRQFGRVGDQWEGADQLPPRAAGLVGGLEHTASGGAGSAQLGRRLQGAEPSGEVGPASGLAESDQGQCGRVADRQGCDLDGAQAGWVEGDSIAQSGGLDSTVRLADDDDARLLEREKPDGEPDGPEWAAPRRTDVVRRGLDGGPWSEYRVILCADGKCRRAPQPTILVVADGLSRGVGHLRAAIEAAEGCVNDYANAAEIGPGEAMWRLLEEADAQVIRAAIGGQECLPSTSLLLAVLCQLSVEGWPLTQGILRASKKASSDELRVLWGYEVSARPSRQHGLDGQPDRELANAVQILSRILARTAQEAWGDVVRANASTIHPLRSREPHKNRVGRLRAYGNAIVPALAAEFIAAAMSCLGIEPERRMIP